MNAAFEVVARFEAAVAAFAGAPFAVAVDCCTSGIFLACKRRNVGEVTLPARTYVSVPAAVIHAGGRVRFVDAAWQGVYELAPWRIYDGAKRFQRGMYHGGLHCLSFHAKKHLAIGRGGMVLCDTAGDAAWLRRMRYDGREGKPYALERIAEIGWHMYMTPEQAARGLQLLELLPGDSPDLLEDYPDLRDMPAFASCA